MKKRVVVFLVVLISMALFVSSTATVMSGASFESTEENPDEIEPSQANGADVPTWEIGYSWTYSHKMWMNDTQSSNYFYLEEEFTYTVDSIEYFELNESTYLSYNLTLEGKVIDGEGEMDGYIIDVNGGSIEGYKICKVSDLGVVENRQYRRFDATEESSGVNIDVWQYTNQSSQPPIENYDFPVSEQELFWANTTMRSWGYYRYKAPVIGGDSEAFDNKTSYESEITIPYKEPVSPPAGDFEAYYVNHSVVEGGYSERWYDSGVQSYVKSVQKGGGGMDRNVTGIQNLQSFNLTDTANNLSIAPSEQRAGNEVTLAGQFPDHPNENVIIKIPEGAEPVSEWTTTTDGGGNFEEVIEVPLAEDMTETSDEFSSVGFVAELDNYENEQAVATLVILHDNVPIYPNPPDGAEGVGQNPEMSVLVGHDKDKNMDVTFYDASDDSEIGFAENVSSIDYAQTTWDGLNSGTTYEWYAVADDGVNTYESEVWSFTTQTAEGEYFQVDIISPTEGEQFVSGETVTVEYEVENTGEEAGQQDIEFYIGGNLIDSETGVSLEPGETYEGIFTWDTTGEQLGDYHLRVASEDDYQEVTVTVTEEVTEYDLTINIDGEGSTDPSEGTHTYPEGEEVTVEATPDAGWYFVEWTGDHMGTDKVINITMNENKSITAVFEEEDQSVRYELTIDSTEGGEVIQPGEGTSEYDEGETVDLEAEADDGYEFVEWTGEVENIDDAGSNETTITMNANYTITAEFEEFAGEYELVIDAEEGGTTSPEPDTYTYSEGEDVTIEAIPEDGWQFSRWEGDVSAEEEENDEITITMDDNKHINAQFLREPFFEVEILSYDEEVTEGEIVTVEYRVTNTGDIEGTQTIEFTVDGALKDNKELTLTPGEEDESEFTWEAENSGEFELAVTSFDDEDQKSTDQVSVSVIDEDGEDEGWPFWWLILSVIVIVGVILAVFLATRESGYEEEEITEDEYMEEDSFEDNPPPPPEDSSGP
ncbi:MAG: CARDB domain-containing protein [Candidatus Thermoplasmatota archaeon]